MVAISATASSDALKHVLFYWNEMKPSSAERELNCFLSCVCDAQSGGKNMFSQDNISKLLTSKLSGFF